MTNSWRKQSTHREETKAVKEALATASIQVRKVGHGRGTAWVWLVVYIGRNPGGLQHETMADTPTPWRCRADCPACVRNREIDRDVLRIVQEVTGREGDYDGRVLVLDQ